MINCSRPRYGVIAALVIAGVAVGVVFLLPPIRQKETYHAFFDQRLFCGIPNFSNVISNLAFLIAAAFSCRALRNQSAFSTRWERVAYLVLVAGVALTGFGSAYYHLHPNTQTLFWDRLPMTLVFMSILATTIGERVSTDAGRWLLAPLLVIGVLSVLYWRVSGDLRWYGLVEFLPMAAVAAMLLLPKRYSGPSGTPGMLVLYLAAKCLEQFDHQVGRIISTGGHPWKHVAGAAAILWYAAAVERRSSKWQRCARGTAMIV